MTAHFSKLLVVVFLALPFHRALALPDDPFLRQYQALLIESQSGGHSAEGLSPQRREEFLSEPLIKDLVSQYRKSMRKTGHPAKPTARASSNAFIRLYENHLLEVALRSERGDLNKLVVAKYSEPFSDFEYEDLHMGYLGLLYDNYMLHSFEGYTEKDSQKAASFGALAYYVVTEAYVRIALYSMGYHKGLSTLERMASVLTSDNGEQLQTTFWTTGHHNLLQKNLGFAIQAIEKISGKGSAELVTEYQTIFAEDRCVELLAPRHPSSEG